jgi:hypothetical protein
MNAQPTTIVYEALRQYEGRPFTPVLAILMTDVANKALRDAGIDVIATVGARLAPSGTVQVSFKRKERVPAFSGGTVEMIMPDGTKVPIGTVESFG